MNAVVGSSLAAPLRLLSSLAQHPCPGFPGSLRLECSHRCCSLLLPKPVCSRCDSQARQLLLFDSCLAPSPFRGEGGGPGAASGPTTGFEDAGLSRGKGVPMPTAAWAAVPAPAHRLTTVAGDEAGVSLQRSDSGCGVPGAGPGDGAPCCSASGLCYV